MNRKQFVVTVLHPTRANVSRDELSEKLAALYKSDKARVAVFGLKTKFGGGSSQGFGLIYDDEESQKKFEPKYRLVRVSAYLIVWGECDWPFFGFSVGWDKEMCFVGWRGCKYWGTGNRDPWA